MDYCVTLARGANGIIKNWWQELFQIGISYWSCCGHMFQRIAVLYIFCKLFKIVPIFNKAKALQHTGSVGRSLSNTQQTSAVVSKNEIVGVTELETISMNIIDVKRNCQSGANVSDGG